MASERIANHIIESIHSDRKLYLQCWPFMCKFSSSSTIPGLMPLPGCKNIQDIISFLDQDFSLRTCKMFPDHYEQIRRFLVKHPHTPVGEFVCLTEFDNDLKVIHRYKGCSKTVFMICETIEQQFLFVKQYCKEFKSFLDGPRGHTGTTGPQGGYY